VVLRRFLNMLTRIKRAGSSGFNRVWAKATQNNVTIPTNVELHSGVLIRSFGAGAIRIGNKTSLSRFALIEARDGRIQIGSGVFVGQGVVITAQTSIEVGDGCQIAEYVSIRDQDHDPEAPGPLSQSGFKTAPIIIGSNVWLGARVSVARGVRIGDNAVVGAGAVVTSDIPANSVAVGVPARVIRTFEKGS
jgi:acetyltransferase-like isoleucine patch superfamily enzyme